MCCYMQRFMIFFTWAHLLYLNSTPLILACVVYCYFCPAFKHLIDKVQQNKRTGCWSSEPVNLSITLLNTVSQEILFNKFSMSSDSEMRGDAQSIISGGRNLLVSVSVTMLPLLPSRVDQGSRYIFCIVVVTCIYERYMKLYFLIQ